MTEAARSTRRRPGSAQVGSMLRAARHRRGLSGRQAAGQVGISVSHLLSVEAGGRCPSTAVAEAIAGVLGLGDAERERLAELAADGVGYSRPGRTRMLRPVAGNAATPLRSTHRAHPQPVPDVASAGGPRDPPAGSAGAADGGGSIAA